jgi:hypothetical protein
MANNGGGDSNNAWVGKMIDHFAPFMMNEIKNQQTKPALPAPAPTPTKTPAPQQPVQEEPPVMMMMKGYLKMLAGAAAKNAPVEEYADSILDMIPDSELPQFEAMLRAPDWQAQLARHTDVVNAYPVWFTGLRETIIAYIDEDRAEVAALTVQSNGASVLGHENDNPGSAKANDNAGGNT